MMLLNPLASLIAARCSGLRLRAARCWIHSSRLQGPVLIPSPTDVASARLAGDVTRRHARGVAKNEDLRPASQLHAVSVGTDNTGLSGERTQAHLP